MSHIENILKERNKTHGDFREQANISQQLKVVYYNSKNYQFLTDMQKEAIEMILHKIARVLAGNPNEKDHFIDIEGYSNLVSRELSETLPLDTSATNLDESDDMFIIEAKEGYFLASLKDNPTITGTGLTKTSAVYDLGIEVAKHHVEY